MDVQEHPLVVGQILEVPEGGVEAERRIEALLPRELPDVVLLEFDL